MSHQNDLRSLLSQNKPLPMSNQWNYMKTDTSQDNKGNKIDSKSKSIIKNVIERCKREKDSKKLLVPIEDCEKRVAYYIGCSETYIRKLCNERNIKESVDPKLRFEIASTMRDFYSKRESHTYKYVYEKLFKNTNDPNVPQFSQFCREMAMLGYDYRKTLEGYLIMEDPKITFERFHYLKKIKNHRNKGRYIYYVDERVINFERDFKKPCEKKYEENSMLLFHMISKYGYENGLYCYHATADVFMKWLIDILMPLLKPSSVIVIDNGPFHGKLDNATISRYHTKEDMLKWLRDNNIPCDAKMHKAELYELIDKCSSRTQQYHVDRILEANGHEVLRLPTNYYDLSPTHLLWKDISLKSKVWTRPFDTPSLRQRTNGAIASVSPEKWREYDEITRSKEIDIAAIDAVTASYLENHKLDVDHLGSEHTSGHEKYDSYDDSEPYLNNYL